jgi:tetratricopeptide (TPR) repeat protein
MKKYLIAYFCILCLSSCAKDYVKEAQIAYNNKDYNKVITIADKGLNKKNNFDLLGLRGLAYFELMQFNLAAIDLNKVIASGSGTLEVMEKAVLVNIYIDRNELAVSGYKELLKRDSTNEEYYYHRAEAYTNLEYYDKALKDLDKALSIDSNYLQAINQKGIIYQKIKDFKSAIVEFTKAININTSNNPEILYFNRGVSHSELDLFKEAMSDFNYSIELNNKIGIVFYNRAMLYAYQGNKDSCCADLEKAIELGHKELDKDLLDYCNMNPLTK